MSTTQVKEMVRRKAAENVGLVASSWNFLGDQMKELLANVTGEGDSAAQFETRDQPALALLKKNLGELVLNVHKDFQAESDDTTVKGEAKSDGEKAERSFITKLDAAQAGRYDLLKKFSDESITSRHADELALQDARVAKDEWIHKLQRSIYDAKAAFSSFVS